MTQFTESAPAAPKTAFLFPGQGSQVIGMGQAFYDLCEASRHVIDTADALIPGLKKIMFEGPEETLKQTQYTQPALLAAGLAAWVALSEASDLSPVALAGHSLGEYAALVASGALTLEQALPLVKRRAELMSQAPAGKMAAIVGLSLDDVMPMLETSKSLGILVMANHNSPEQVVISGEGPAVEAACALAAEKVGPRRAIMLPVSGAFHSPLMQAANDELAELIRQTPFQDAKVPVITNVDGQATTSGQALQDKLAVQMISSVRWVDTLGTLTNLGISHALELGCGKVLTGLSKKTTPDSLVFPVNDPESLKTALEALYQSSQKEVCV